MKSIKDALLYNGPQTPWNEKFIRMIDMRMDDRPWTPEQEVMVMRTVSVLIRMIGENILSEIFYQHIPQVICASDETVLTRAVISVEKIKDIINKITDDGYITHEI